AGPAVAGNGGGNNRLPPPFNFGGNPGGDDGDDSDSSSDSDGPDWKPREAVRREARRRRMTPDQTMDLNVMGRAIGEGLQTFGKNHVEPPPIFEAKKYENVKLRLISCEDFFNCNPREWVKQKHMILYAISRTKGEKMAHFTSWYRLSMTGEEGYQRETGLLYWERFRQEIISRYANTAEEREALQAMEAL